MLYSEKARHLAGAHARSEVITLQEEVRKRKCKHCGKLFVPDNEFQGFCSEKCY